MKRTYRYPHGLQFSTMLAKNLDALQDRVNLNKTAMIIIDGGLGEGKTTLLLEVLDYINHINGLPQVKIDGPQLAMGGKDFLQKLRICYQKKLPCIGYDEAGDFTKRGSLTQFNAMLNRTFETFRAFKCIVVMTLPNFNVLDQQILDNQIPRLLLHLKGRTKRTGNFYAYSLYTMLLLKNKMNNLKIKNYAYAVIHPNFYGHFLDLEPKRSKELDKISTKNKLTILRKSEISIEGLMTYSEMATKLFRSIQWCRQAVSNLKIKPARKIGRVKYFDKVTVDILTDHADKCSAGKPRKKKD